MVCEDLTLARKIALGDDEAFDVIYKTYEKQIYYHILRFVNDRHEAQDVTQEVFLKAYQFMGTYSGKAAIGRWLRKIATNLCIDRIRKRSIQTVSWPTITSREGEERTVEFGDEAPSPLETLLDRENETFVLEAIQDLPEYYRKVVVLRDLMDRSGEEIANEIDCPVGTVKSRLSRAHGILRSRFKPSNAAVMGA